MCHVVCKPVDLCRLFYLTVIRSVASFYDGGAAMVYINCDILGKPIYSVFSLTVIHVCTTLDWLLNKGSV